MVKMELHAVLSSFGNESFTANDVEQKFAEVYPEKLQEVEAAYGKGGKGNGSYYTARVFIAKQLSALARREYLIPDGKDDPAPPGWGAPRIHRWKKKP